MNNKRISCGLTTLVLILSLFFFTEKSYVNYAYGEKIGYGIEQESKSTNKNAKQESKSNTEEVEFSSTKDENFTVGNLYNGFELLEKNENHGEMLLSFQHKKSGAKLFAVKNNDVNKHFSIAFRTPVYDNKGVAHILEHCVLVGGSEKYPVKQLLKEVMESSLSKDMNGITTSDTTIYPFSTTNEKEFTNIMDIYMDMVFNPLFYKEKRIFREEGWYYENTPNGLKYNGVVYNEMKGALSTMDGRLYNSICKSLYPDTTYAFISGGDPYYITDLTFDELKKFHEKYYHPSNSYIYLYGDMNISSKLKDLNNNYLKKYQLKGIDSNIEKSSHFQERAVQEYTYASDENNDSSNKSVLTYNFSIDEKNPSTDMALEMLDSLIISNPNSVVYKNLHREGFNNVSGTYVKNLRENFYSIIAYNCQKDEGERFAQVVEDTLLGVFINGIDRDIIEAELNKLELSTRWYGASSNGRGTEINRRILDYCVYGLNPMGAFAKEEEISTIMKAKENYFFEEVLHKHFIKNDHKSIVILSPEKGLSQALAKKEMNKLQNFLGGLKSGEYETIMDNISQLRVWQSSKSDEEYIDRIPKLKMEDVNPILDLLPSCRRKKDDVEILYHPWATNGTSKMNIYFNLQNLKKEDLCYAKLLASLMGKVNTNELDTGELEKKVNSISNGINYSIEVFTDEKDMDKTSAYLKASFLTKNENLKDMMCILNDEMLCSDFDHKSVLKSYLNNIISQNENLVNRYPEVLGMNKNMSCYYEEKAIGEYFYGLKYFDFIKEVYKNIENQHQEVAKKLCELSKLIFNKNNITISITTDNEGYNSFQNALGTLTKNMTSDKGKLSSWDIPLENTCEAILCESEVLYNTEGFNYKKLGYKYNGNMKIMKNILEMDYLWDKIRVEGGAYGANILLNSKGAIAMASYRDPKLVDTLKVFEEVPLYLDKLNMSSKELESYKISTLAEYCNTKTLDEKVNHADYIYFSNITRSDLERELWEIKTATLKDIKKYKKMFKKGLDEKTITVVGNKREIVKNKKIFNKINSFY